MEDYTALVEVLTSIDNHLSHISMDISIFCWLFFFMLLFKDMNNKHEVDKLYQPLDSISTGFAGVIDKFKNIEKAIKDLKR